MKAYELLAKPESWTKCAESRDSNNHPVYPLKSLAVKWCVVGAILKCYPNSYEDMIAKLHTRIYNVDLWNDHPNTNHAAVIAVLKKMDI